MVISAGQHPAGLYELAAQLTREQRPFAVATVLQAENSTPVKAGARALIEAGGRIHGTVGGGQVEAEALRRAETVICLNQPVIFNFDLHGPSAGKPGPICGGAMRLLVAPGSSASEREYQRAATSLARRQKGLWITRVKSGRELQAASRFKSERSLKGKPLLKQVLQEGSPRFVPARRDSGDAGLFVEPLVPGPVLLVVGGGHVGQALAAQAGLLDFDLVVLEDRPEFANPALFPVGSRTICGDVERQLARFPIDQSTFIVIVTRGHQPDIEALRACIRKSAAYIGMIGSSRKVPLVRREFLKSGWATATEFDRVYAPIGLDIGAVTVPEIAASILAQVIAVRRRGEASRIPLK